MPTLTKKLVNPQPWDCDVCKRPHLTHGRAASCEARCRENAIADKAIAIGNIAGGEQAADHAEMCPETRPGTVDIDVPGRIADEPIVSSHPLDWVEFRLTTMIDNLVTGPQRQSVRDMVQTLKTTHSMCRHCILLDATGPSRIEADEARGQAKIQTALADGAGQEART